jgi:O-antigen/teichoic acid export membrane protein
VTDSAPSLEIEEKKPARLLSSTGFVFVGHAGSQALNFIAILMIMRALGPSGYGVVAIATTFFMLGWQLIGRGWDQALVRIVSEHRVANVERGIAGAQTVHTFKWLVGGALIGVFLLLARPLTDRFAEASASAGPMGLAGLTALAAAQCTYTISCLQAGDAFRLVSLVQLSTAVGRALLTGVLWYVGMLTPTLAMACVTAGFALGAILGYRFVAPEWRGMTSLRPHLGQMFGYSRWLVISSVIFLFYTRLDQLLLGAWTSSAVVGVFAAAMAFVQVIDLLTNSILTVMLPRMCRAETLTALRQEVWKAIRLSAILALLMMPGILIAPQVVGLILGEDYADAPTLFMIVYPAAVLNIITHPLQAVMHARGKTLNLLMLDLSVLTLNLAANLYAIPTYGMYGAAVVALCTRLIAGVGLVRLIFGELRGTQEENGL